MKNILYIFSGEKAQGAEIVIERLMMHNAAQVNTHLFIAPGSFANSLIIGGKPYKVKLLTELRRLFRSKTNGFSFLFKALVNHCKVSYKVYRYLKKENIDIIHANNIVACSYLVPVVLYAKLFLRKKVWVWSDHDMGYSSKVDKAISKIAVRLYHCTLAVSGAVSKKYNGNKKVRVLYNGLNTDVFKPDAEVRAGFRSNLHLPADAVLLGMAGKITPGKGHLGLIEVFNQLLKSFPGIYLVLAGGFAEDSPAYNDQVMNAIVANKNIVYMGFLHDMIPYYNGCDIIINNSDRKMSESLGTTIYEAMAFEKIVVASKIGGTPEIISDNRDGFLFTAENRADLLVKLIRALNYYSLAPGITKVAREKVKQKFSICTMAQEYNSILHTLEKTGVVG